MTPVQSIVLGLCLFIALLNFKPSEPYLSQFLICNQKTANEDCSGASSSAACENVGVYCSWDEPNQVCQSIACDNVSVNDCNNSDYFYCEKSDGTCKATRCYEDFSESEVNNEIYPWSTFAYLPFLLLLGPFAELYSYRVAILFGILGRVVTRIILLYGTTMTEMRIMQVAYALGTAAEDVFSAYVYYVVPTKDYQYATSAIKAAALISCVLSGILGDILVVEEDASLKVLMWISAVFVWAGFAAGLFVIGLRPATVINTETSATVPLLSESSKEEANCNGHRPARPQTSKVALFAHQLRCLWIVLQSRTVLSLLAVWIVGNGVFQTLYDYEVSIFQELQGQNSSWNGSVLAVMLVAGSIGAMIPAMEVDPVTWVLRQGYRRYRCRRDDSPVSATTPVEEADLATSAAEAATTTTSTVENEEAEVTMTSRIMWALVVSTLSLVGFICAWEVKRSVTCLSLFFSAWQYITVIVFSQFATYLRSAEATQRMTTVATTATSTTVYHLVHSVVGDDETAPPNPDRATATAAATTTMVVETSDIDPPYSLALVLIIAVNVVVQIIIQVLVFTVLEQSLYSACTNMVWVFGVAAVLYILCTCGQCGLSVFQRSWQRWWKSLSVSQPSGNS